MKAIQFDFSIPRYGIGLALGRLSPKFFWSGISCMGYEEIPTPVLRGDDWVLIKTRLGGICGTDMSAVKLTASTYSTTMVTFPFVLGHENIGTIEEVGSGVSDWQVGDRVVAEPLLWCMPRGFTELCINCEKGEINRCERITEGDLDPGYQIGICKDTGGSWSPYFLAHQSQLYRVPDNISDENGLMIEPFAIALHAVLQNFPGDDDQVLIIGAGTIGLLVVAALRALGSLSEIIVQGRYAFQAEAAQQLGASRIILGNRDNGFYYEIAQWSEGKVRKPIIGKPVVLGGVDMTFECVGSSRSLDDALRLTHNGGRVIMVGEAGVVKKLDLTSFFTQELEIRAANMYNHAEEFNGKHWKTFDLAIELLASGKLDLGWLVTHQLPLEAYKRAFELTTRKSENKSIKVAFKFDE
jgi:L-iditol 2-dehydrogenase